MDVRSLFFVYLFVFIVLQLCNSQQNLYVIFYSINSNGLYSRMNIDAELYCWQSQHIRYGGI